MPRPPRVASSGSVWITGAGPGAGDDGWLARFDPSDGIIAQSDDAHGVALVSHGQLVHWNEPEHDCVAIAEGKNGRMFLQRTRGLFSGDTPGRARS